MYRKLIVIASLSLLYQISFAETCPSVNDIKHNALHGWKMYDSDDGSALTPAREVAYKQNVLQFALAEWVDNKQKTAAIHCYYRDKAGSGLEAYLAKDAFTPNNTNHYWYTVSGYQQCAAGMSKCQFEQSPVPIDQVARVNNSMRLSS